MPHFLLYGAQFLKLGSLKTKKTDDVSKWLIICLTGGLSLRVAYGVIKVDMIIAIADAILGIAEPLSFVSEMEV